MLDQFIGRFHPLLVHIPIGVLIVAIGFDLISRRRVFRSLEPSVPALYLIGAVGGVFSCITGYLLSSNGEYATEQVNPHMWMGIGLTILAFFLYLFKQKLKPPSIFSLVLPLISFILLTVTGHLGGNLTHGENYLTQYAPWNLSEEQQIFHLTREELPHAYVYTDIVQPILQTKCYRCHSTTKQKGKLRLDEIEWMLKGGKSGIPSLVVGDPEGSEMIHRILLPLVEEEHMPPKGKPQVSSEELTILRWWIAHGGDIEAIVADLPQPLEVRAALDKLIERGSQVKEEIRTVANADPKVVTALEQRGFIVLPISADQNWLSINTLNVDELSEEDWDLLGKLSPQVVSLKTKGVSLSAKSLEVISQLTELQELSLNHSSIQDEELTKLKDLHNLQSLNVTATSISDQGIKAILDLQNLEKVFVFGTDVSQVFSDSVNDSGRIFIERGGYILR
ncbi:MAG: c-type cytochrome domain-containing protein [Bacteroidota bacterium]